METKTMKAAVMYGIDDVRVDERPVPSYGPNDVLVRIGAVGVCGSDVHYYKKGKIGRYVVEEPIILGHESGGTVVAVGEAVTSLVPGDRVAIEPGVPCRHCEYCKTGRYNLCPDVVFMATPPIDGAFCEYYTTPADFAFKLPDNVSLEEAAMMEPLACGIHAVRRGRLKPGETVVIFGAGTIGLMVLQAAKAFGALNRIVLDVQPERLKIAQTLGATQIINPEIDDPYEIINQVNPGGADVVIEAAGANTTSQLATRYVRRGGRIVWVGLPGQDYVPMSVLELVDKEVDFMGVFRYANVYPQAIQLTEMGLVDVRAMITHKRTLEQAGEAMDLAYRRADGVIKVLVLP
jgi:L-iditol 2-dehydrogenase